jgi:hypothetical protein
MERKMGARSRQAIVLWARDKTFVPGSGLRGQRMLDLGPFDLKGAFSRPDREAPDLTEPRPTLRIVPGKLRVNRTPPTPGSPPQSCRVKSIE